MASVLYITEEHSYNKGPYAVRCMDPKARSVVRGKFGMEIEVMRRVRYGKDMNSFETGGEGSLMESYLKDSTFEK